MTKKNKIVYSTLDRYPTTGTIEILDNSIFLQLSSGALKSSAVTCKKKVVLSRNQTTNVTRSVTAGRKKK